MAVVAKKSAKKQKKSAKKQKEDERNYELVTRPRRETGAFFKSLLRFLFSNVGLVILAVVVGIGGRIEETLIFVFRKCVKKSKMREKKTIFHSFKKNA
jgi:hypothetical protein